MSVKLGGSASGGMPRDGRAYVVVDGKWLPVATDETDGIPAVLDLPDDNGKGGKGGSATIARETA